MKKIMGANREKSVRIFLDDDRAVLAFRLAQNTFKKLLQFI